MPGNPVTSGSTPQSTSFFKRRRKAKETHSKLVSASQEQDTPPQTQQQPPRSSQPLGQTVLQPTPVLSPDTDINSSDLFRPQSAPLDTPSKANNAKPPRVVSSFNDITPKKPSTTTKAATDQSVISEADESTTDTPLPATKVTTSVKLKAIAQSRPNVTTRANNSADRAFVERISQSSTLPTGEEAMKLLDIAIDSTRLVPQSLRMKALAAANPSESIDDAYVLKLIGVVRSERHLPGSDPNLPFIPYSVQNGCLQWLLDNLNVFPDNGIPALTRCLPIMFQLMLYEFPRHLIAELIVVALVAGKSFQKWYYNFCRRQFEAHPEDFYIGAVFNVVRGLDDETPAGLPYPSPKITWRATTIQLKKVYEEIDVIHARGRKGTSTGLNGTDLISRWFTADANAVIHRILNPASHPDATPAYVALKLASSPQFVKVFDYIVSHHLANPATKPTTLSMVEYVIRASGIAPPKAIVKAIIANRFWSLFTLLSAEDVVAIAYDDHPVRYVAALIRWIHVHGNDDGVVKRLVDVCQHDDAAELTMMRLIAGAASSQLSQYLTLGNLARYLVSTDPMVVSSVCQFLQQFKREYGQRANVETAIRWLWRNQTNAIAFLSSKLLDQLDKLHVFDEVEGLTPLTMGHFYFHPGFSPLISSALPATQGPNTIPEALASPPSCGCDRHDQLCAQWLANIDSDGFHGVASFLFSSSKSLKREERAAYAKNRS